MLGDLNKQLSVLSEKQAAKLEARKAGEPDKLLQYFTKLATKTLDAERASIFVVDPDTQTVWLKAGTDLAEHDIEVSTKDSIVGTVIRTGRATRESGLEQREGAHRDTDEWTGFVTQNLLCVPILDAKRKRAVGAIQVLNKKDGTDFDDEDQAVLDELAEHVQLHVQQVYDDQDLYTLSERVVNAAQKVVNGLMVLVAILVVVAIVAAIF